MFKVKLALLISCVFIYQIPLKTTFATSELQCDGTLNTSFITDLSIDQPYHPRGAGQIPLIYLNERINIKVTYNPDNVSQGQSINVGLIPDIAGFETKYRYPAQVSTPQTPQNILIDLSPGPGLPNYKDHLNDYKIFIEFKDSSTSEPNGSCKTTYAIFRLATPPKPIVNSSCSVYISSAKYKIGGNMVSGNLSRLKFDNNTPPFYTQFHSYALGLFQVNDTTISYIFNNFDKLTVSRQQQGEKKLSIMGLPGGAEANHIKTWDFSDETKTDPIDNTDINTIINTRSPNKYVLLGAGSGYSGGSSVDVQACDWKQFEATINTTNPTATPIPNTYITAITATSFDTSDSRITTPNSDVTIRWGNIIIPTKYDWIGLYKQGDTINTTNAKKWLYTNCRSDTPGDSGVKTGSCVVLIPPWISPGNYEFSLFSNNSYTDKLAGPALIIVQAPTPTPTYYPGQPTNTPMPTRTPTPAPVSAGSAAGGKPCQGELIGVDTAIGCIPTQPEKFVAGLFKFGVSMGGGIALLLMAAGVFQMMTSAGNPEGVKKGSEQITNAIIGLLFIIFAVLLLQVIGVDILQIPGFGK